MKIRFSKVLCQVYVFPYVKITYDRFLNGDIEIIVGWLNREVVIAV